MPTPATSPREAIIQAARTWAKDLLSLVDNQVLAQPQGDSHGPAVDHPRLVVFVSPGTSELMTHERNYRRGGDPESHEDVRRMAYSGTLSIEGYGDEAEEWLQTLALFTDLFPEDVASIQGQLAYVDVTVPDEDGRLERIQRADYLIEYVVERSVSVVEALSFNATVTLDGEDHVFTGVIE